MPYYLTNNVDQETLEPTKVSIGKNNVKSIIDNGVNVWNDIDFFSGRNLNNDVLVSKYTGWYESTSRYVNTTSLIPGNKYVYIIVSSGQYFGTARTWAGNSIEQRGYNFLDFGSWNTSLTWSMLYANNNSVRGRIGGGNCSKTYQGTFTADDTGSSLIATMGSMSDNKTPSFIKVFDYNLAKNIYNKAGKLDNFNDEVD